MTAGPYGTCSPASYSGSPQQVAGTSPAPHPDPDLRWRGFPLPIKPSTSGCAKADLAILLRSLRVLSSEDVSGFLKIYRLACSLVGWRRRPA